jgi:uncharacterized NAD(P)/FAD-binding protein YdhS
MRERAIVVIGGGASGTLVAAALVAQTTDVRVVVVEPRERLGCGVAYSTECPVHLLNVPAGKISAFPDRPDHFVRWLSERSGANVAPSSFVPRSSYGDYLNAIATDAQANAPYRLRHVKAFALDARVEDDGVRVACSDGSTIAGDALVIASGNASPAAWPNVCSETRRSQRFFDSAWDEGATAPGDPNETVLLLGTGLTAVDAVLALRHHGHRGATFMVSRRGLLPHEHRVFDTPPATLPDARTVSELLDAARAIVREEQTTGGNWRGVVDNVRPRTNALWQSLPLEEQRRFMRHALTYWNVHRHRIPPESAKAIAELIASGALRMIAGRTGPITARDGAIAVPIKLRGSAETLAISAGRVINCSGPQHDFRKLANPLIASLLAQGALSPNPLDIGVRVAENGAFVDANGVVSKRTFSIGPARFGTLIETTAIPEIRVQARDLADLLAREIRAPGLAATA